MENGIKKIGVVIADKDEFIPFAECVKKLDFKTFNFFKSFYLHLIKFII